MSDENDHLMSNKKSVLLLLSPPKPEIVNKIIVSLLYNIDYDESQSNQQLYDSPLLILPNIFNVFFIA